MEYKAAPTFTKAVDGRTITGIFAVHGNRDSYDDISHPGSFARTINAGTQRIKFLWNHDFFDGPPIAVIKGLREVTRDELPDQVLDLAPNATGGVEVAREYLMNERANAVYEAVASGASNEMSYGYDAIQFSFSDVDGVRVRNLHEIRLWEVSDTVFGANPATVGSKLLVPDLEVIVKYLESHTKAGARHSASDTKLLNAIHTAALELGATNCQGVLEDIQEGDDAKTRPGAEGPPLTLLHERLRLLALSAG